MLLTVNSRITVANTLIAGYFLLFFIVLRVSMDHQNEITCLVSYQGIANIEPKGKTTFSLLNGISGIFLKMQ
jgi:hypothetical protein